MPIINSLLDTDLYKLTMMQGVLHQFPWLEVEYDFKCRNKVNWTREMVTDINGELDHLCSLSFRPDELDYLQNIRYIKNDFIDFLRFFRLDRNHIVAWLDNDSELCIKVKGSWLSTILFEVPVLAIINEVYRRYVPGSPEAGIELLRNKIEFAKSEFPEGFRFADFGTRRRYSRAWQHHVLATLKEEINGHLFGTSNVLFAKEMSLVPVGTMAHEWLQAGQAVGVRLVDSQKKMLQAWVDEYRGDLGIALSDVVGIDAFLRDFDLYFAKLYDGVRHDSGDPLKWAYKVIDHYRSLKIDPRQKSLVFSDGLDFMTAVAIYNELHRDARVSFGIGTNLTNDFGDDALQIVIKMTQANGQPVAKISDSAGKGMCHDEQYLQYLKRVFRIES